MWYATEAWINDIYEIHNGRLTRDEFCKKHGEPAQSGQPSRRWDQHGHAGA